ncbi:MAG: DUF2705 family protein [Acutalibacteraceae bacterium]|mgnify:CR=1 FL=1
MKERIFIALKNNKNYMFVVISIMIQKLLLDMTNMEYYGYYFLSGVPITANYAIHNLCLALWFFPVYFILQVSSGKLYNLFHGYGTLLIVRNYSKLTLICKHIFKLFFDMLIVLIFQVIVININNPYISNVKTTDIIRMIIIYFFTFIVLLLIQTYLELYIEHNIATLIINIYIVLSVMMSNIITLNNFVHLLNYFFIPCYGMGFRNGIIESNYEVIFYNNAITILIFLIFTITYMIYKKMKRNDIL